MLKRILVGAIFLGAFGLGAYSPCWFGKRELSPRPRLFVGHYAAAGVWTPEWGHAKDIWRSCPDAVFMWDHDNADYQLMVFWSHDHWSAQLFRSDDAYMLEEDSPDFNRILRDSCKALRYDSGGGACALSRPQKRNRRIATTLGSYTMARFRPAR